MIKLRKWVKVTFFIILSLTLLFIYARYINIKGLKVKEYSIVDNRLPDNFYGLKIVQISDIHYKVTTDYNDLKKVAKQINLLKPDIVILTGDLFDKNIKYSDKDFNDIKKFLKSIDCSIEKLAIKGENDLEFDNWSNIIEESGFKDINNTYEEVFYSGIDPLLIIGVETNYNNDTINETIDNIYSSLKYEYKYSILVLHEPDLVNNIDYSKFNLILAGHSHNGQIVLPFIGGIIKNKGATKYFSEYYELNNTKLYISSGIGTSKYKFRFLNKPSINLYRLRNK